MSIITNFTTNRKSIYLEFNNIDSLTDLIDQFHLQTNVPVYANNWDAFRNYLLDLEEISTFCGVEIDRLLIFHKGYLNLKENEYNTYLNIIKETKSGVIEVYFAK